MFRKLLGCVREYKTDSLATPVFMIGEAVIECIIPFIIAELINRMEAGCEFSEILKQGLILLLLAFISLACGGIAGFTASRASAGFAKNLRHDMFHNIQKFSFENIDRFSSSSLVTRMTTDVTNVQMSFMMIIRIAVRSPLMFIFSIIMSYRMGGALASMFVVVVPILGFGLFAVARKAMPAFKRVFKRYDRLNESIEENVMAMRAVKSFVREEYEKKKFGEAAESIRDDFTKAERIVALNSPLMQFCLYFDMIFVLLIGSRMVISGFGLKIGVGQLSAMLTYGFQILMALNMLSMIYVMLTISAESMRRIVEVLDEKPALTNPENALTEVPDGSIDFDNVSFKYSAKAEKCPLSNINIHIKSGETIGVLGGTGSGKSTFVQLISRLYDVTEGTVSVGGHKVGEYDLEVLRNSVSVVLQKNVLFEGSIKDNLRWGDLEAADEEIVEACHLACADEFIETLPGKYDYMIEQGGTNVSGGQKQRLCIARALLKKPKILILDDSTSAVDTKTDAIIRRGLASYLPDTTKIIIAQRVASVQDADKIILFEAGEITACGNHEELMKSCDIYREIYTQQTRGSESNG